MTRLRVRHPEAICRSVLASSRSSAARLRSRAAGQPIAGGPGLLVPGDVVLLLAQIAIGGQPAVSS
ncbi:hypothetical protein ACIBF7_15320 [Nonomuraea sp. NPDC050478]|uniref:hypothetical protein n=1 Tax=Nonomuraea sp. NPDC050478 TaxID=3364365 RepID=UPI0037B085F3